MTFTSDPCIWFCCCCCFASFPGDCAGPAHLSGNRHTQTPFFSLSLEILSSKRDICGSVSRAPKGNITQNDLLIDRQGSKHIFFFYRLCLFRVAGCSQMLVPWLYFPPENGLARLVVTLNKKENTKLLRLFHLWRKGGVGMHVGVFVCVCAVCLGGFREEYHLWNVFPEELWRVCFGVNWARTLKIRKTS